MNVDPPTCKKLYEKEQNKQEDKRPEGFIWTTGFDRKNRLQDSFE